MAHQDIQAIRYVGFEDLRSFASLLQDLSYADACAISRRYAASRHLSDPFLTRSQSQSPASPDSSARPVPKPRPWIAELLFGLKRHIWP